MVLFRLIHFFDFQIICLNLNRNPILFFKCKPCPWFCKILFTHLGLPGPATGQLHWNFKFEHIQLNAFQKKKLCCSDSKFFFFCCSAWQANGNKRSSWLDFVQINEGHKKHWQLSHVAKCPKHPSYSKNKQKDLVLESSSWIWDVQIINQDLSSALHKVDDFQI